MMVNHRASQEVKELYDRIEELTGLVTNMEAAAKALIQAARPHINNDVALTRAWHDMRKAMPIRLVGS